MAKYNYIQTNFKNGEVTEKAFYQPDDESYRGAVAEIRNMIVDYDGAAWMRPGTQYMGKQIRSDGVNDRTLAATDKVFPLLLTNPYSGSRQQWHVFLRRNTASDIAGVAVVAHYTSQYDVVSGGYNASLGNAGVVENVTNFPGWDYKRSSQLTRGEGHFSYTQAGNTLFITAPHVQPMYVRATFNPASIGSNPTFSYGPIWANPLDGATTANSYQRVPYFLNANTAIYMAPSATTGTVTITTTSDSGGTTPVNYFVAGHVGAIIKLSAGAAVITVVGSATSVTAVVLDAFSVTTRVNVWEESCWSGARGFPQSVEYWNQRLVFAGTAAQPDTIWFSQTGDVSEFSLAIGGSLDSASAFDVTISQKKPWNIRWIAGTSNKLFIGTEKEEHSCGTADPTSGFGFDNVSISKESEFGSVAHQAFIYENAVLFIDKSGKRMRQLVFDDLKRVYDGLEVATFSEFVFDRTRELNADTIPKVDLFLDFSIRVQNMGTFDVIWILRGYSLFSITINRQKKVSALSHHYLGGDGPTGYNYPTIRSLSVGQSGDNAGNFSTTEHAVMIVQRNINGTDVVYAERMGSVFSWYDMKLDADALFVANKAYEPEIFSSYLDCHFYDKVGGTDYLMTKLVHLQDESVVALVDGIERGPYTVNGSGQIDFTADLDAEPDFALAGFQYKGRIKTIPPEAGSQIGSSKGSVMRIDTAFVQFFKTVGLKAGYLWKDLANTLEEIDFTDPAANESDPIALFTGNKELQVAGASPDEKAQIVLEHTGPYPCTICGIIYRGQTYD